MHSPLLGAIRSLCLAARVCQARCTLANLCTSRLFGSLPRTLTHILCAFQSSCRSYVFARSSGTCSPRTTQRKLRQKNLAACPLKPTALLTRNPTILQLSLLLLGQLKFVLSAAPAAVQSACTLVEYRPQVLLRGPGGPQIGVKPVSNFESLGGTRTLLKRERLPRPFSRLCQRKSKQGSLTLSKFWSLITPTLRRHLLKTWSSRSKQKRWMT